MENGNWQVSLNSALAGLSAALLRPGISIADIADMTLQYARRLTHSEHGYVSAIDPETHDSIGHTLTQMMGKECQIVDAGEDRIVFPIRPDGMYPGLWGHVLNTREAFYTNAPDAHPASAGCPQGHIPLQNFLSIPAIVGDTLVGQVALANSTRDYVDRDLETIGRLAELYAMALYRQRTEAQLLEYQERLEGLVAERTAELQALNIELRAQIEERQKVELALRRSESRFRGFFEQAGVGIALIPLSLDDALKGQERVTLANPALQAFFGYSEAELAHKNIADLSHPEDLEKDIAQLNALLAGECESYQIEKRFVHKRGHSLWGALSVALLRDSTGTPTHVISTIRDITEHIQAEHALRKSEDRYRTLVEQVSDAILIVDAEGYIRFANPAAATLLGRSSEQLLGEVFGHPVVAEQALEVDIVRPDGTAAIAELRVAKIIWEDFGASLVSLRDVTARREAMDALRQSEERFRLLAENAQDLIFRYRFLPEPGFEYVSPSATTITGYTPEEHYADPELGFKLVHPEDRHILASLSSSPDVYDEPIVLRWVRKDGVVLWTEQYNVQIYNSYGQLVAIEGVARDITERKQAEQALYRMALFAELNPDPVLRFDKQGLILMANPAAHKAFDATSLVKSSIAEILSEIEVSELATCIERDMVLSRMIAIEGRNYYFIFRGLSELGFGHLYGTDITARVIAERDLRASEARNSSVLAAMAEGVVIQGADGAIQMCNASAERILGLSREEMSGRTSVDSHWHAIHEDGTVFEGAQHPAMVTLHTGEPCTDVIMGVHKPNGELSWISINTQPMFAPGESQPYAVVSSFRDITARKQAEQALQHAHQDLADKAAALESANEELSQYAYVVSHDLRAPLRALHNYADFLWEDLQNLVDEDQKMYLEGMQLAVHEAEDFVSDLLQFSRLGRRTLELQEVDIGNFLKDLVAGMDIPEDMEVVFAEAWPTLEIEPVLFKQIYQNLLDNALKFNTSACKRIILGWQRVDDSYEFYVRDNGIGIDPKYHRRIFNVFERLHTQEEYPGTGIGLAIVKKAVSRLNGAVRVESELGKGSTFYITFPHAGREG